MHRLGTTDWQGFRSVVAERAALYPGVPGLRAKAFLLDQDTCEFGANYVWETREALNAFLESDLFAGAVANFGQPVVRVHEVLAYVDAGTVEVVSV